MVQDSIDILRTWCDNQLHGSQLVALRADADRVGAGIELLDEADFINQVDVVVALGGDGTMLGAMRLVANRPVPVLGVNYGNLGFLVEVEPHELRTALARIDAQEFSLEPHHALELVLTDSADGAATAQRFLAFNDISVARRPGTGVISADLTVDGTPHGYYRADAIIVSTPAGSTAYNYAAGGPVLSPAVAATIVTPVAPMSGINRSVVLGPNEVLCFALRGGTPSAAIEVDGRVVADASDEAELTLRLMVDAGSVIRLDAARHSGKGRLKLSLLDLPLRSDQLLELVPPEIRKRFHDDRAAASAAPVDAVPAAMVPDATVRAQD
ncbi:MAG: N-acetylmuramoyl-L-alanine amidase [Glaciihabitans sp.]|nr:N-acetylmuramoyl-L-alanine amidase [Glaciihabitans sp.]